MTYCSILTNICTVWLFVFFFFEVSHLFNGKHEIPMEIVACFSQVTQEKAAKFHPDVFCFCFCFFPTAISSNYQQVGIWSGKSHAMTPDL